MEDSSSRLVVWLKNSSKIVFRWIAKTSLTLIIIVVLFPGYFLAGSLTILWAMFIGAVQIKSVQDNNYSAYRASKEAEEAHREKNIWTTTKKEAFIWTLIFYGGLIWYMGLQGAIATTQSLYIKAVYILLGLGYLIIQNIVTALST